MTKHTQTIRWQIEFGHFVKLVLKGLIARKQLLTIDLSAKDENLDNYCFELCYLALL